MVSFFCLDLVLSVPVNSYEIAVQHFHQSIPHHSFTEFLMKNKPYLIMTLLVRQFSHYFLGSTLGDYIMKQNKRKLKSGEHSEKK